MDPAVSRKVEEFFTKFPRRVYPKGQILVFAGEDPEHIFYLVEGRVREYDVSYRGDEVIINIFKPPAFFPMSWAINRAPNQYFYKTETNTILHSVPPDEALAFLKANPDVMLDLLGRLYRGMQGLEGRIVQLMAGTAKSRLLYELVIECRRFGVKQSDNSFMLELNEVDLAARTGLSRETVSREMQKLKDRKLVSLNGKTILVNSLDDLQAALGDKL